MKKATADGVIQYSDPNLLGAITDCIGGVKETN